MNRRDFLRLGSVVPAVVAGVAAAKVVAPEEPIIVQPFEDEEILTAERMNELVRAINARQLR